MVSNSAPGELETVREFINTLNVEERTDAIADPEGLRRWMLDARLISRGTRVSDDDVSNAIRLREALRDAALTNNGAEGDPRAVRVMEEAARASDLAVGFAIRDGVPSAVVTSRSKGVSAGLGQLLSIVAESMRTGTWERLKACESDECRWAFYDKARNRSGRWCDMAVCGNRMKARAYRARNA